MKYFRFTNSLKLQLINMKYLDYVLKGLLFIIASPLYVLQWIGFLLQPKSKTDFLDNKNADDNEKKER